MELTQTVSWKTYAEKYDMLLAHNPFYQDLHREVMEHLAKWDPKDGSLLADIGAGTGNYSLAMARLFPDARVLHYDNDAGMNYQAASKRELFLDNHQIHEIAVEAITLEPDVLDGLISIHALYTFSNPSLILKKMFTWLKPGAQAILVDAGRVINVLSWQLAIGFHLLSHHGYRKTVQIMNAGKEVSRQNKYIRQMQREGRFWTHNHSEFCQAVEDAGFKIRHSKKTFRGVSDLVIATKV